MRMLTNGLDVRGKFINERKTGAISSSPYPLDFHLSQCVDLTCGTNYVAFYTTNATGGAADFEERTFVIRSASLTVTCMWPTAWSVLGSSGAGTLPTSLAPSQLVCLKLRSVGPGESNRLAEASIGADRGHGSAPAPAAVLGPRGLRTAQRTER